MSEGLEAAHRAGLVHRDIKPSNIMITPEGDAKLLDLGLARALDDETGLTRANTVLGTLDYASPEQLRDAAKADVRSDMYSLGCTLYFALSGNPPFEGGDMINKIYKQRMEDPPPLENRARGVPAAFAAVVRKLMSKNPEERYQNAAELRADLARWTDPERVRAILGAEAEAARSFHPATPRACGGRSSPLSIANRARVEIASRCESSAAPSLRSRRVTRRRCHRSRHSFAIEIRQKPRFRPLAIPIQATAGGLSISQLSPPPPASSPSSSLRSFSGCKHFGPGRARYCIVGANLPVKCPLRDGFVHAESALESESLPV